MVADIGREDQRMQDFGCAGNAEGGVSALLRDGEAGHGDRGAKRLSREGMSHDIGCIFWILDFGHQIIHVKRMKMYYSATMLSMNRPLTATTLTVSTDVDARRGQTGERDEA